MFESPWQQLAVPRKTSPPPPPIDPHYNEGTEPRTHMNDLFSEGQQRTTRAFLRKSC
ncbi:hypothetical protein EXN66_Car003839 [Channa argus]|uniref:Uncharacterized protein n=1 Tax=Channa argus TaxID=215402 RepID=A0A6G1PD47_CHAAH|nr:hypothetical protein EXN66_Car003839 [Channa argus]